MVATVKSGLAMPEDDVLPGPIKLHSKAATVYKRAMDDKFQSDRGLGVLSAFALAASEEKESYSKRSRPAPVYRLASVASPIESRAADRIVRAVLPRSPSPPPSRTASAI